ncbi:MAG: DUF1887 family protein [Methylococcaceae bacterium]|nr:DUF1887 family protein [Methylococcaceae bacterium]
MTITTHLILISAQPIPNLTPIFDDVLKPKKVVMLVSHDMQERSNALESIFKPRGISVERCLIEDPWNADSIRDQVEDLLITQYPDGDIALNATGGTKLMSIAAYEAFRSCQFPVFYVHPEHDRLIWLSPKLPDVDLSDRLKLEDYLMAYGSPVDKLDRTGVKEPIRELTQQLLTDFDRYANELGTLNYLALKADNFQLTSEIEAGPQSRPLLWELLELFEVAGLCKADGHNLRFTDENARFTANGGWLEIHTYALCLNLKKACGIQDVACNINLIRQPAGRSVVKNEIDIGLIKANRLHLIECKTQQFKGDKTADVLYKMDSLRDLMGGLQGRAMLVSFNPLDKASQARAKELNIQLCCQTELRNLQQHLQTWLTNKR